MGTALGISLTLLAVMVWLAAFAWLNHMARHTLRQEMQNVMAAVTLGDTLHVDAYNWNEPHHRFRGRHVDPFFLQVFDPQGNLLRASDNIATFPRGAYPRRVMAATTLQDDWFDPLRTFRVDGQLLYYATHSIYNMQGERLGTVQVAREEPGVGALYWRTALVLLMGLLGTLVLLGGLIWWVAGRVLRPLETITVSTRAIAPDRLGQRIPVPEEADRETIQLAATLNTLLARLEQSFDEMRRFTASAAHELKTPLTVLRGHVDVALRRPRDAEDYRETLGLVRRKIDHLVAMVSSLLALARLDRGAQSAVREPVDLARLVRAEAVAFQTAAADKNIEVALDVPTEAPVWGQEEMLREVVINLLDNAIKYTLQGRIDVRVVSSEEHVTFTVADTGVGMDDAVRAHATDRFYRAASVDAQGIEGSGLGLALVDQIVQWHDGRLDIASVPDEGTTVRVQLPAVAVHAPRRVPSAPV